MTQTQSVTAETCDHFLRQGREFLAQGDLASASAAGWQAAVIVMANYAGSDAEFNFTDAAQRLVKDHRGHAAAAEWVVSAMALSDNAGYDWLDSEGVARRLDDVQRLAILVKDIAEPPQSAEDVLRRAWECMGNGALAVASEKGWEAATHAAKTYAQVMGHNHIRSNYLSQVTRYLKQEPDGGKAGNWSMSASMLLDNAYARPNWLDAELIGNDLDNVSKLVALVEVAVEKSDKSQRSRNV